MKILQVHNEYRYPGGEEVVLAAEHSMLTQKGHQVSQWVQRNKSLKQLNILGKAKTSLQSIWSYRSYRLAKRKIQEFLPDIVHVHNTLPLITPSIYSACKDLEVPVVQTLHNYKFICPGSNLYRNEKVCEDCVGKFIPIPALMHGCYRRDYLSTFFAVSSLIFNRFRGAYRDEIDRYIALTDFAKNKFIEGGLPPHKVVVKPNFLKTNIEEGNHTGNYVLYVGRLIPQKGVHTLLKAWSVLNEPIPLKVVGQGALESLLTTEHLPKNVEYLGPLERKAVLELMKEAKLLIFPTEWYEVFGLVLIEAFSTGLPVVASRIGGVVEIVKEGESGWHFTAGDAADLARVVQAAWQDITEIRRRGSIARQYYEKYYTQERNYQIIMDIYNSAIASIKHN